jgi:hypothetical protein
MRALDYRTKQLIIQERARRLRVTKIAKELGIGQLVEPRGPVTAQQVNA